MDRDALAEFLRRRREAMRPEDVGLRTGTRPRRTVGLRREEVAQLTGMSVDYYGRLEQSRSTQPSPQMVRALARALRLTGDETDHLYRLAGHAVPDRVAASMHVRPALLFLLDQMRDAAAFICSDTYLLLAQNELAKRLMGDRTTVTGALEESIAWQWFTDPGSRANVPNGDHDEHSTEAKDILFGQVLTDLWWLDDRVREELMGQENGDVCIFHGGVHLFDSLIRIYASSNFPREDNGSSRATADNACVRTLEGTRF